MKKQYEAPKLAFVIPDQRDILTLSPGGNETPDEPNPFMLVH